MVWIERQPTTGLVGKCIIAIEGIIEQIKSSMIEMNVIYHGVG